MVTLVGAAGEADTVGHRVKLRFGVGDHVAPEALAVDRRVLANRVDVNGHGGDYGLARMTSETTSAGAESAANYDYGRTRQRRSALM